MTARDSACLRIREGGVRVPGGRWLVVGGCCILDATPKASARALPNPAVTSHSAQITLQTRLFTLTRRCAEVMGRADGASGPSPGIEVVITVSAKDRRSACVVFQELYGSCRHEPAGVLTPCRYRAPGGRAGALRARPLNDPTLCARPFDGPGRPRLSTTPAFPGPIPLHTPPPQQDRKALRPSPRRDEGQYSGGGYLGAFERPRNLQSVVGQGIGRLKFANSRLRTSRLLPVAKRWGGGSELLRGDGGGDPVSELRATGRTSTASRVPTGQTVSPPPSRR